MKLTKKWVSFGLAAVMTLSLMVPAMASESELAETNMLQKELMTSDGGTATISIPAEYDGQLTDTELQDFADGCKDGDFITIYEIHDVSTSEETVSEAPYAVPIYRHLTTKTKVDAEFAKDDKFVISVARGETVSLSTKFSAKLVTSVSGTYYVDLGFTDEVVCTIDRTKTFTGPDAPYNSREYRVKFYAQKYNWTQERYLMPQNQLIGTKSGTAEEAVRYASYSIDRTL